MIKEIADENLLNMIANELLRENFKPGFDGMSAENLILWLKINMDKLIKLLLNGKYEPMPVMNFSITKKSGKPRLLGKVTAVDTMIQRAIVLKITKTAECIFSEYSFAYRQGRGVSTALQTFCTFSSKHRYAAAIDIDRCFNSINHDVLFDLIFKLYKEKTLCNLIMSFVKAPYATEGTFSRNEHGLHQGAPNCAIFGYFPSHFSPKVSSSYKAVSSSTAA